jgi:hypothetical protein
MTTRLRAIATAHFGSISTLLAWPGIARKFRRAGWKRIGWNIWATEGDTALTMEEIKAKLTEAGISVEDAKE